MDDDHPLNRFTNRVDYYVRYRPRYPRAIIPYLQEEIGLSADAVIADVGSGTGFLAERFLQLGCVVYAVEPNPAMREAAEKLLAGMGGFHSVPAMAEDTSLAAGSVDVITAGQAFHWFEANAARQEFRRILRSAGHVIFVYNHWNVEGSPLADAYRETMDRFGLTYGEPRDRQVPLPQRIEAFFHPADYRQRTFDNPQKMDFQGLRGRVLSASYGPLPGHEKHEPMMAALRDLFATFAEEGSLTMPYQTEVYWGQL